MYVNWPNLVLEKCNKNKKKFYPPSEIYCRLNIKPLKTTELFSPQFVIGNSHDLREGFWTVKLETEKKGSNLLFLKMHYFKKNNLLSCTRMIIFEIIRFTITKKNCSMNSNGNR